MRAEESATELRLQSGLPKPAALRLGIALGLLMMYAGRAVTETIPPQDHIALSLLICGALISAWTHLDRLYVTFSLTHDRCWMTRRRFVSTSRQSIPVTQIHSARTEPCEADVPSNKPRARVVLLTSMGKIALEERYFADNQRGPC